MFQGLAVYIYHKFRQNRLTFKMVIRLKELGVNKVVKGLIGLNARQQCSAGEMQEASEFLKQNQRRIQRMLNMLEDGKSRQVWRAVMLYRSKGRRIPGNLWSDNDQYFVKGIIRLNSGEVFVDGGAFVGDTIQHLYNYAKRGKAGIKKVIAFEPDKGNLARLQKNFSKDRRLTAIAKGLSDKSKVLFFSPNGSTGRFLLDTAHASGNVVKIPCTRIDEIPQCKDATFIKLDVEGAELAAIMGGAQYNCKEPSEAGNMHLPQLGGYGTDCGICA